MIPDWETNYVCFSALLPKRHRQLWADILAILNNEKIGFELLQGTKDIWCRDYMPIQASTNVFVQFRYFPDYLRHAQETLTPPIVLPWMGHVETSDIVLDGGNVTTNGELVVVTDKVRVENPGQANWQESLSRLLGSECVITPRRPHEVTGHIDGLACFLSKTHILVTDLESVDEAGYALRFASSIKNRMSVDWITTYVREYFLRFRFPTSEGCYINFLRVGDVILFPQYGQDDYDADALKTIRQLLPQCRIYPIYCKSVAKKGGALHCISWNVRRNSNLLV